MSCVMCTGQLKLLGQLGSKTWTRCIACGWDQEYIPSEEESQYGVMEDEE